MKISTRTPTLVFGALLAACAVTPDEEVDVEEAALAATTTVAFAATADAEVRAASPTQNFGASTQLTSDKDPERYAYLAFDVRNVTGPITRAVLRCYVTNPSGDGPAIYETSTRWTQSGVTFQNRPRPLGPALADKGAVANGWLEYDVTAAVRANGAYSFILAPTSDDSVVCNSREAASNRPELRVTYEAVAGNTPPTAGIAAPAEGAKVSGVGWASATGADPDGVAKAEIILDARLLGAGGRSAYGYLFPIDTRTLSNGWHEIRARVTDAKGAATLSPPTRFEVTNATAQPTTLACPSGFAKEVFRDDFDGTALDTTKWQVVDQGTGGGIFTQLTAMRRENVSVSGGLLRVASKRHCSDPRANRSAPEHTGQCPGGVNFYSGGWIKSVGAYAPGKGLMMFRAKMPAPVRGYFPALWARNTEGGTLYAEFDLNEMWWDHTKGVAADPNKFVVTTHLGTSHTSNNVVGPFANMVTAFHVWEVEWDAGANPAVTRYYYRDAVGATRTLVRTVNHQTSGLAGKVTAADYAAALTRGFRPYVDFAVQPDTTWHVGPDSAAVYDPDDLLVDSIVVCKP